MYVIMMFSYITKSVCYQRKKKEILIYHMYHLMLINVAYNLKEYK